MNNNFKCRKTEFKVLWNACEIFFMIKLWIKFWWPKANVMLNSIITFFPLIIGWLRAPADLGWVWIITEGLVHIVTWRGGSWEVVEHKDYWKLQIAHLSSSLSLTIPVPLPSSRVWWKWMLLLLNRWGHFKSVLLDGTSSSFRNHLVNGRKCI